MKRTLFFLVLSSCFTAAFPQEGDNYRDEDYPRYKAAGIFYDQDYTLEMLGLRRLNEDRNYTMGLGFYYSDPSLQRSLLFRPHAWLNRVFDKQYLNSGVSIPAMMLANGSFTPDSLPASYVIRNDRPYSSLTYLQTIRSYVDMTNFRSYTSTLSLGLLGSYISREVQTVVHNLANDNDTKNPRTPRGWNNQVSAGGELTAAYAFKKERLITKKHVETEGSTSVNAIELKDGWQYSLGYYTALDYEFNLRFGKIDPRHWTYMVNPLSQSNRRLFVDSLSEGIETETLVPEVDYYEKRRTFEIYLFASARPSFILYNALLNGQFKRSIHTIDFQDMKHLVMDFDGGVATSIPAGTNKLLELKLKISGRSPEFKLPGRAPRWHYWGGVEFLFSRY